MDKLIAMLAHPVIWRTSRFILDATLGLYRKRIQIMKKWDVFGPSSSVLDIGCGIGHFSRSCEGQYVGIDLSEKYIEYAKKTRQTDRKTFLHMDVRSLHEKNHTFSAVLLADILHHLDDLDSVNLLKEAKRLSSSKIISFEPIQEQTSAIGAWFIANDRGQFIRPLDQLHALYKAAGLTIQASEEFYIGPMRSRAILCEVNPDPA